MQEKLEKVFSLHKIRRIMTDKIVKIKSMRSHKDIDLILPNLVKVGKNVLLDSE